MLKYKICPICFSWLKDHTLIGWRACSNCNYRVKKEEAMISLSEINPKNYTLDEQETDNINVLLERINKVRTLWGKPMIVNSGVRSKDDQIRVYHDKGVTDLSKIPMGSQHLHAAAVDISDPDGKLAEWTKNNEAALEEIGLWCEDLNHTKGWVHYQIFQYRSWHPGKSRFFIP